MRSKVEIVEERGIVGASRVGCCRICIVFSVPVSCPQSSHPAKQTMWLALGTGRVSWCGSYPG